MIRRDVIAAALLACILTVLFYGTQMTRSAAPYDAWLDYNEDGTINMRDIGATVQAFGASGDPAKNVTIAGHANKLAYYVKNEVVPATSWFTSDPILVDGYSKMTVSLTFSESQFDYHLWTTHDASNFVFRADQGDETTWRPVNCKTYDVVNMYVKIRVYNPGEFEGALNLDVYLIP